MRKTLMYILGIGVLCTTSVVLADILLPPAEEARLRQRMEQGQAACPKDRPLFDGETCRSCNDPVTLHGRYTKCEEICPNRKGRYECGPACALKDAPSSDYIYVQCQGWKERCKSGFQGEDGKCYTCADVEAIRDKDIFHRKGIYISKKDCLSCKNTQYIEGFCVPACPKDKPLWVDFECASCDLEDRSGYVKAGCNKCSNRFEFNGGCYKKCPANKPILGLTTGQCFSCRDKEFSGCTIQKDGTKSCWQARDGRIIGCSKCTNKLHGATCVDQRK